MLTHHEKQQLLVIARDAIASVLNNSKPSKDFPVEGGLLRPSGAFVTLRIDGDLRGCIGFIESEMPLNKVVAAVAAKAATEDPRFPRLTVNELTLISIEVSALSPLRLAERPEEVMVGIHGVLLEAGKKRGLLLPQVAVEHNLDRDSFLNAVAKKAGLPESAWKSDDAKIFIFEAEVFGESEFLS